MRKDIVLTVSDNKKGVVIINQSFLAGDDMEFLIKLIGKENILKDYESIGLTFERPNGYKTIQYSDITVVDHVEPTILVKCKDSVINSVGRGSGKVQIRKNDGSVLVSNNFLYNIKANSVNTFDAFEDGDDVEKCNVTKITERQISYTGTTWFDGTGIPSSSFGVDGDYYLEIDNSDIFKKEYGMWKRIGNIKGIQGLPGIQGDIGPVGPKGEAGKDGVGLSIKDALDYPGLLPTTGEVGDAYLIQGHIWVWSTSQNVFVDTGTIRGPQGDAGAPGLPGANGVDGINGVDGKDGSKWFDGIGNPTQELGTIGDYYINIVNSEMFKKSSPVNWERIGALSRTTSPTAELDPSNYYSKQEVDDKISAVADISRRTTHNQVVASKSWLISHNLNKFPQVSIVDSGNNVVIGDITHIDLNNTKVDFLSEFSGMAYLS